MAYGTVKVDNITFTNGGSDQTVTVSGIVQSISGSITATGTIQGATIIGTSTVSGATVTGDAGVFTTVTGGSAGFTTVTGTTVTGTTANFNAGTFTSQVSGATVTGNLAQFTTLTGGTAGFTTVTGATVTGTTANFVTVSGTTVTGNAGQFTTITGTSAGFTTITGATVTGTVGNFGSGSEAAPSVSVGTADNGLYSPGTDQVALSTNGTGRLFVDASGRISVANQFTDSSLASNIGGLNVLTSGSGDNNALTLAWEHQNLTTEIEQRIEWLFSDDATANNYKSAGFIGMGKEGTWQGDSVRDSYLAFATTDAAVASEKVRITSAGLVGIGTSAPAARLDIAQASVGANTGLIFTAPSAGGANNGSLIALRQSANTTITSSIGLFWNNLADNGNSYLSFSTGTTASPNTERMRITAGGNVGIGTTSPSQLLHLSAALPVLNIESSSTTGDGAQIRFEQNNGRVGRLYLTAEGGPGAGAMTLETPDGRDIVFKHTSTENARIDSSGRLLVGTASSSANARGLFQANPGSSSGNVFLCSSLNAPPDGATIGGLVYADSGHVAAATILGQRDAGTWTSGSSQPTRLVFSVTADGAASPTEALRISSNRAITVSDGGHIVLGTGTGTKIGTSTSQKLGFYNATPVVQPAAVADATAATVITQLNDLLAKLRTLGIIAT